LKTVNQMTRPVLITTASELEAWAQECHASGETIGLVPTMGNLHAGHLSLVEVAHAEATRVVVSVFVNPTQFSPGEDFERYPRSLGADIELLSTTAADVVFAPSVDEVYPPGSDEERVDPGPIGDILEGAVRPGHFEGVLRVCKRLFELSHADVAVFGEKDAQQLFLVSQMVDDLSLPIRIVSASTIRAEDGLALSSRNAYLSAEDRASALALPQALRGVARALEAGEDPAAAVSAAQLSLSREPEIECDYIEVASAHSFELLSAGDTEAIVAGAITVGGTRLIDNVRVHLPG
jgi:pantoate--beta-alanine ligase